jgi:hypothetical protein
MHGVIDKMKQDNYDVSRDLIAAQNDTVVVSCREGTVNNHLAPVLEQVQGADPVPERAADRMDPLRAQGQAAGARPRVREAGHPDPEDADGQERDPHADRSRPTSSPAPPAR